MTNLPQQLQSILIGALTELGDVGPIMEIVPVGGGCINNASQIITLNSNYFIKWNARPLPNMFTTEASGLKLLRASNSIRVPEVYKVQEAQSNIPAFILMEWINKGRNFDQRLCGRQLAELHRSTTIEKYGLDYDNYIGSTPQQNIWRADWIEFFRECRLQPQIELAIRNGRCDSSRKKRLEVLLFQLEKWLRGVPRVPSLLHGDLWGGNVIGDENGNPVLIDPAVYYGDREADLAFTQMFGGFSKQFFDGYQEVFPLEEGYRTRFEIYNIYHILNHLNLFGEGYGSSLDATLRRFVG